MDELEAAPQRKAFLKAYSQAVSKIGFVEYVFSYGTPMELDIFTVFRGDRRAVRPTLYGIEAKMLGRFPRAYPDIRLLPIDLADVESLQAMTQQVFPRS